MRTIEKDKIKGAIRTDFILSAEIIVIALGIVSGAPFLQQVAVLAGVAVLMTIGVYGLVAGIVKLDDAGLYLTRTSSRAAQAIGDVLLAFAPKLMKLLAVVGTVAMFLVGGGIIAHNLPPLHHLADSAVRAAAGLPGIGRVLAAITPTLFDAVAGVVTGALVLAAVMLFKRLRGKA
jgi:predicted DNA repair protein MutK